MLKTSVVAPLVLAMAIGTGMPTTASAEQASPQTYSRPVRVSDLDLSSQAGARALLQRIRVTAGRVCLRAADRVANDPLIWTSRAFHDCVQQASGRAVTVVNNPMVTSLYAGNSKLEVAGN